MCYGYSSWFGKTRADEHRKAQEKIDALDKKPVAEAPAPPVKEPARTVEQREKVPV